MFLLAWIFLGAAMATLYFGLSEEGRAFLYLSMAASGVTVVLAVLQLRRPVDARTEARRTGEAGRDASQGDTDADDAAPRDDRGRSGSSSPGP